MQKIVNNIFGVAILVAFVIYQFVIVGLVEYEYDQKALYVAKYQNQTPDPNELVDVAFWLAERDIRYHMKTGNDTFLATELSATANLSYNLSYILNLPAKLIHNIRFDIQLTNGFDQTVMRDITMAAAILFDIVYAIVGFVGAWLMLVFGTLVGLLFHPINTILDIPACIWGLIKTIFYAIYHLFAW